MKKQEDYELFLASRLFALIASIRNKFNINLEYLPPNSTFQNNVCGYSSFEDGYIFLNNERFLKVEFRLQIKKQLKNLDFWGSNSFPTLVFSRDYFLIVQREKVSSFEIDSFPSQIIKLIINKTDTFLKKLIPDICGILNTEISRLNLDLVFVEQDIVFDQDFLRFRLSDQKINLFFYSFLPPYVNPEPGKKPQVCRYTSQESIFNTIDSEKQRMYGLAAMNDREEINYTDKYLYGNSYAASQFSKFNGKYILSCSSMKSRDNLTMFRLYSSDAKGVCVSYEIFDLDQASSFYLKKVEYEDEDGVNQTLEKLKKIMLLIGKTTGQTFDFFGNSGWKYFFKPKDYSIENEVRLLYDGAEEGKGRLDKKWVITNGNGILNPYIEFDLHRLTFPPLAIKEILIGPKHPEQALNQRQYQDFVNQHKSTLGSIEINISSIKNYR